MHSVFFFMLMKCLKVCDIQWVLYEWLLLKLFPPLTTVGAKQISHRSEALGQIKIVFPILISSWSSGKASSVFSLGKRLIKQAQVTKGDYLILRKSPLETSVLVTQSCPTLRDPMNCSLPGFSVHGILQARILEWIDIPFSRFPALQANSLLSEPPPGRPPPPLQKQTS